MDGIAKCYRVAELKRNPVWLETVVTPHKQLH